MIKVVKTQIVAIELSTASALFIQNAYFINVDVNDHTIRIYVATRARHRTHT